MIHFTKAPFLLTFILFLAITNCISQDALITSKINYYKKKADTYLDKEKALYKHYSIDNKGISIYETYQKKLKNDFEFHIAWEDMDDFNDCYKKFTYGQIFEIYSKGGNYQKAATSYHSNINADTKAPRPVRDKKKLNGLKIAIDPGHIAGDMEMGDIEKKCLNFEVSGLNGKQDSIAIAEGALTFATAKLLKNKLEEEGAEVFMTRTFNSSSAFGLTFDNWLISNFKTTVDSFQKAGKITISQKQFFLNDKASKRDKFRVIFKELELAKRAEIINNYKPDLTIIIHYNVDETNTGWAKPTNKNFNMAFVGGAFFKNDLTTAEKRFAFLRLLLSSDLEKSILLSAEMMKSCEKNLNVKTAEKKDAKYLSEGCLSAGKPGVYCRNLQLTRTVNGPLVYGETLYQDNINECIALNKNKDKTKNIRVQQVAEAYFQGVLNFVANQ